MDVTSPKLAQAVFEASLDAVVVTDGAGLVLEFNPAAERLFGFRRGDVLGKRIGDLIVPHKHRAAHEAGMARCAAGHPARVVGQRLELEALHRDGHMFPVELSIIETESEGQRYFAASLRDLSERHAREAELRARQDFLRALVDDQSEMVIRSDANFRIQFCNEAVGRFFGLSREELIGMQFTPGTPDEVKARLFAELPLLTPDEPVRRSVDPKINAKDELRWLEWSNRALFDDNGGLIGHVSVARDITDARRSEEALATSEARFAAFVENAPVAMFLKDEAGRYVVLNNEACKVIGKSREEILGRTAREVGTPQSADQTEAADRKVLESGKALSTIGPLTKPGEAYHWAMILRFPVVAPEGEGRWIGGFAIDVTAQHQAEQELERSREALHQSEKLNAMGSLLAGVAHELNNPLAIVVAQATMLEEDAKDGPLARRAEKIRQASDRCGRIVKTFLSLARRQPSENRLGNLNDMARSAVELLGYPLRTSGIDVELALDPTLPQVEGEVDLIAQVVLNLLVNAQQALDGNAAPRRVRIATGVIRGDVVIEVSDNGPGVPEEIRQRIFEPFFSTKPQGMGTGVGLSFCHNVVTTHKGRLELLTADQASQSPLGPCLGGAVFRVNLPVAAGTGATASEVPGGTIPGGRKARALVVDDEPDLAEILAEMLSPAGFEAEVALSVAEAKSLVGAGSFDVIFSDLRMPGEDGRAFHAWLSEHHPDQARRIAFVTGDALGVAAIEFLARSGRPCLEKPFSRSSVLALADELAKGSALSE